MTSTILVDADACPVKEEIYKVAYRTDTPVVSIYGELDRECCGDSRNNG